MMVGGWAAKCATCRGKIAGVTSICRSLALKLPRGNALNRTCPRWFVVPAGSQVALPRSTVRRSPAPVPAANERGLMVIRASNASSVSPGQGCAYTTQCVFGRESAWSCENCNCARASFKVSTISDVMLGLRVIVAFLLYVPVDDLLLIRKRLAPCPYVEYEGMRASLRQLL